MERIGAIEAEAKGLALRTQQKIEGPSLANWRAAVALALWRGGDARGARMRGIKRKVERFAYDSGMLGERAFGLLVQLDAVDAEGNDGVRAARKAVVQRCKRIMATSDTARTAALRLAAFVCKRSPPTDASSSSDAASTTSDNTSIAGATIETTGDEEDAMEEDTAEQHQQHDDKNEKEDEDEDEDEDDEESDGGDTQTQPEAQASPSKAPRWHPEAYQQRLRGGGTRLVLAVPGVAEEDVRLHLAERRLTVAGSSQRGWFKESFDIAPGLDLDRATSGLRGGALVFTIPAAAATTTARAARTATRPYYTTSRPHRYSRPVYPCGFDSGFAGNVFGAGFGHAFPLSGARRPAFSGFCDY